MQETITKNIGIIFKKNSAWLQFDHLPQKPFIFYNRELVVSIQLHLGKKWKKKYSIVMLMQEQMFMNLGH